MSGGLGKRMRSKLPKVLHKVNKIPMVVRVIKEAMKLNIPIIAVVDTNNSFDNIDYFFPGNDDSMRAINLYCTEMSNAIQKGQEFAKTQKPVVTKEEIMAKSAKNSSDEKVVVKKKKIASKKVATKKVATKKVTTKKDEDKEDVKDPS